MQPDSCTAKKSHLLDSLLNKLDVIHSSTPYLFKLYLKLFLLSPVDTPVSFFLSYLFNYNSFNIPTLRLLILWH
jgi:hypothetical protein